MAFYPEKNTRTVILSELICIAREQMARGCMERGKNDAEQNDNECANEYNRYVWGSNLNGGRGLAYCAAFVAWVIGTAAARFRCTLTPAFAGEGRRLAQVTAWDSWARSAGAVVSAPAPGLIYTRARLNLAITPRTVTSSKRNNTGHMGFIEEVRADGSIVTIDANAIDGAEPHAAISRIVYTATELARRDIEWLFIDPVSALSSDCRPTENSRNCIPLYRTQSQDTTVDTDTTGRGDVNNSDSPSSDVGTVQRRRSREDSTTGYSDKTAVNVAIASSYCDSNASTSIAAAVRAISSSGALHYQQLVDGNLQTRYRIVRDIIGFRGLANAEGMSFLVNRDGSLTTPQKETVATVRKHESRREPISSPIENLTPEAVVNAIGNSKPVTPGFMFVTDAVGNRYIIANEESENWAAFRDQIFPKGTAEDPDKSMIRIEFYRSDNDSTPGERIRDILTNTTGNREPLAARMYRRQEHGIVSMLRKAAQNSATQSARNELNGLADYIANRPIVNPARYGVQSDAISPQVLREGVYFFAAAYGAAPEEKDEALLNLIERYCQEKRGGQSLSTPILIAFRKPNPPFDWGALFSKIFDIALAFAPVIGEGFSKVATPLLTSGKSIAVNIARHGIKAVFSDEILRSAFSFAAGFAPHLQLELESLPVFQNVKGILSAAEKEARALFAGINDQANSLGSIIQNFASDGLDNLLAANAIVSNALGGKSLKNLSSALGLDLSVLTKYTQYLTSQSGISSQPLAFSGITGLISAGNDKTALSSVLGTLNISAATGALASSLLASHGRYEPAIVSTISQIGGDWTKIPVLRELMVPGSSAASFAAIPQFQKIVGPIAYNALMSASGNTLGAIDSARAWVGSALGYKVAPDIFDQFSAFAVATNINATISQDSSGEVILPSSIPAHMRHDLAKELSKCFPGVRFWCGNGDCYSTNDTKPNGGTTTTDGGQRKEFPNEGTHSPGSELVPITPDGTTEGKNPNAAVVDIPDVPPEDPRLKAKTDTTPVIINNNIYPANCCQCPAPLLSNSTNHCNRCGQSVESKRFVDIKPVLPPIEPGGCPPGSILQPNGDCLRIMNGNSGPATPFCKTCRTTGLPIVIGGESLPPPPPTPAVLPNIHVVVNVDNHSKNSEPERGTRGDEERRYPDIAPHERAADHTQTTGRSTGDSSYSVSNNQATTVSNANTLNNSTGEVSNNAQGGSSNANATGGAGGSASGGSSAANNANTINISTPGSSGQPITSPALPDVPISALPLPVSIQTFDRMINALLNQSERNTENKSFSRERSEETPYDSLPFCESTSADEPFDVLI